jgi:hypothetical protein
MWRFAERPKPTREGRSYVALHEPGVERCREERRHEPYESRGSRTESVGGWRCDPSGLPGLAAWAWVSQRPAPARRTGRQWPRVDPCATGARQRRSWSPPHRTGCDTHDRERKHSVECQDGPVQHGYLRPRITTRRLHGELYAGASRVAWIWWRGVRPATVAVAGACGDLRGRGPPKQNIMNASAHAPMPMSMGTSPPAPLNGWRRADKMDYAVCPSLCPSLCPSIVVLVGISWDGQRTPPRIDIEHRAMDISRDATHRETQTPRRVRIYKGSIQILGRAASGLRRVDC